MGGRLKIDNLSKSFNSFKLHNINLDIASGEYFILIGPTGSGKTLLMETINGFHKPDTGTITFKDRDITSLPPSQRTIGYVPQTPNLNPQQTVRQNLEFTIKLRNLPGDWNREIDGVIALMGLTRHKDRPTIMLSGGEKRKAALARAIILKPDMLLLDEPLSSLDITSRDELLEELHMIHRYLDATVIHVTHNQEEALELAESMGIMRAGTITRTGTLQQIYNDPGDVYAASFLGYRNIYPVRGTEPDRNSLKVNLGKVTLRSTSTTEPETVAIHGGEVRLSTRMPIINRDTTYRGTVTKTQRIGLDLKLTVDIGVPMKVTVKTRDYNLRLNDEVWMTIPPDAVKPVTVKKD